MSKPVERRSSVQLSVSSTERSTSLEEIISKKTEEAFAALDKNSDGYVEVEDLVEFFKVNKSLVLL
ncbi:unnamed protein product [Anisakis simplex]|uniref:EF-hand domain-containing protein n=1 Tax=Anisakis simplex TaxID=6269 RepID=A0A0M3JK41_ANISI|nr:unnamed protein product [Anisakis simplex]